MIIIDRLMDARTTLLYALMLGISALVIWLIIALMDRPFALVIGNAGLALGWSYSLKPLGFNCRG